MAVGGDEREVGFDGDGRECGSKECDGKTGGMKSCRLILSV